MSTVGETHGLVEAVEAIAEPVVRAHGLVLVDLDLRGSGRRFVLRFFVDRPGGVTVEDCRRFNEEIGDVLDAAGLMPAACDLEVSSPGLDRELRKERELQWAVGRRVRLWVRETVGGRLELVGELAGVGDSFLQLTEGGAQEWVPRALVTKIRLDEGRLRSASPGRTS